MKQLIHILCLYPLPFVTRVYTRKAWQVFRWIKGTIKCSIKLIRQICTYVVHTEYTPNNFVCSIKKNLPDATGIPKLINCAHYIFINFSETSQDLFENSSLHLKWCRFNRPFISFQCIIGNPCTFYKSTDGWTAFCFILFLSWSSSCGL